jgi:uncharacterized protein (DUF1778 family)
MTERRQNTTRLDFRLTRELKELIEQAACVTGQSVSDFALSVLTENARRVLREHSTRVLSNRDRDRFLAMLDEGEPNEALKKAARRYRKRIVAPSPGKSGQAS